MDRDLWNAPAGIRQPDHFQAIAGSGHDPFLVRAVRHTRYIGASSDPSFFELIRPPCLDEICGPGYRRSLEFLVKDFLIHRQPGEADIYRRTALGACIQDHIDDANIKKCAERAVWVGNDETHYERRLADQDVEDLKRLIRLTKNWIENVLETEQYEQSIRRQ